MKNFLDWAIREFDNPMAWHMKQEVDMMSLPVGSVVQTSSSTTRRRYALLVVEKCYEHGRVFRAPLVYVVVSVEHDSHVPGAYGYLELIDLKLKVGGMLRFREGGHSGIHSLWLHKHIVHIPSDSEYK